MHRIVLLLAVLPLALPQLLLAQAPSVLLELRDGSRIAGLWLDDTIELQRDGATFTTRTEGIWRINRIDTNAVTVILRNGDRLRTRISSPGIQIDSAFGKVTIPADQVQTLGIAGKRPIREFNHRFAAEGGRIDFGRIPELDRTSQLSVAGWYHSNRIPGHQGLFALKRDELHIMRSHFWHNNRIYVHLSDGDISYVSTEAKVDSGKWFHLAVVYNGELAPANRITIYQNGVATPVRTTGIIPEKTPDFDDATLVVPPKQFGFIGRIRLFQVYDQALDAAEIARLAHVPDEPIAPRRNAP